MQKLFENWRGFINEQEPTLAKILKGKITHPKLGELPPAPENITDDHYVEAIMEVARAMSNVQARQWYLGQASGVVGLGTEEARAATISEKVAGQTFAKQTVELTYFVRGIFNPRDLAKIIENKFLRYANKLRQKEKEAGEFEIKPSHLSAAGLAKFNGNSVLQIKAGRDLNTYGQPSMIRFLNSFEKNPSVAKYAPWFVEDISRLDAGRQKLGKKPMGWDHSSHLWGLDVDISVPTLTEKEYYDDPDDRTLGFKPKKTKMTIGKVRQRKDTGYWNFQNPKIEDVDLDGCINFIAHCMFGPGAGSEFLVRNIFIDQQILDAMKSKIREDIDNGKRAKEWISKRIWRKVTHEKKHLHHFHVRLYGIDKDIQKYIKNPANVEGKPAPYMKKNITNLMSEKDNKELFDIIVPAIKSFK